MSHRQIARELGVSAGSVNYCINALIKKGFVKVGNFRESDNKLRYLYLLTPEGVSAKLTLAHEFLVRKAREYQALRGELDALVSELDELNYGQDEK
jgi:EPS-associated MarR family transcriptional regulator